MGMWRGGAVDILEGEDERNTQSLGKEDPPAVARR